MNLLFLAHRIPYPPNKGEKVRAFHQIRHLTRSHEVHLACMVDERDDLRHVGELEKWCASVHAVYRGKITAKLLAISSLAGKKALSVAAFYSKKLQRAVDTILDAEQIDGIFVYSSTMAEYVRGITGIPVIVDLVDVDSEKWRLYADQVSFPFSWIYKVEADRLAAYEEQIAKTYAHTIVISEGEAEVLSRRVPRERISVVPNGVDLDAFSPEKWKPTNDSTASIVFTGAMDYFPNVDGVIHFCGEILPRIQRELPEASFQIVGRNPTPEVIKLGDHPGVLVTGTVPDVQPYLRDAGVAVAPLRIARGVQNKILEAMAMGLPVVGTSEAFRGITANADDGVRIVDDPDAFAREVVAILRDPAARRARALQARSFVQRSHRWDDHCAALEKQVVDIISKFAAERVRG